MKREHKPFPFRMMRKLSVCSCPKIAAAMTSEKVTRRSLKALLNLGVNHVVFSALAKIPGGTCPAMMT
jgi:hypothetical protein